MKKYFASMGYLWILLAMPLAASTVRIYVLNNASDSIDVIDSATNKVAQVIKGIGVPHGVDFSPDGTRAYITAESETSLDVVDTRTGKTIKKVPLSGDPNLPAITKDGKYVLVCIFRFPPEAAVDVVDTTSLERIKTIPMKGRMHDVFVTPDNKYAVAGSDTGKFLSVIDLKTLEPVWGVQFDEDVLAMAIEKAPDGSTSRLFVQMGRTNGFAVVDFAKREEVDRITLPNEPSGFLSSINPCHGIGIAPDGKTLWVNSQSADSVFIYSLPELKVLGRVGLPELKLPGRPTFGGGAHWLTFTPDNKTVYIANPDLQLVSAIDVKALKVIANIPVGEAANMIGTVVVP